MTLDRDLITDKAGIWHNREFRSRLRREYGDNPLPKPDKDVICMICGRNDQVFPSPESDMCPQCAKRLYMVSVNRIWSKVWINDDAPRCVWCGGRRMRMYKVNGYICQHCTVRIAEEERRRKRLRARFRFG